MLLAISKAVLKVINRFKNTQAEAKRGRHPEPPGAIIFKNTEGKTYQHPAVRAPEVKNLFAKAMDWKIMFDLGVGKTQFPAEIIETNGGVLRISARWCHLVHVNQGCGVDRTHMSMGRQHVQMALPEECEMQSAEDQL